MSNYFPTAAQVQAFVLNGAGATAGSTSIVLRSFKKIDGTLLAMSDFGNLGYGTIEPGTSLEEQISFSGVTQNLSNETCTLTGVRSVLTTTPYTSSSGLSTTHAGATTFVISNTAAFYDDMKNYIDTGLSAGAVPSTTSTNGIGKVSVAPVSASSPIFVGDNDYRVNPNNYAADSVGTDSYAITLSNAPGSYVTGQVFNFKAGTANTGACTLNVNSLGAKTIKKNYNSDLETGDIVANQIITVIYDGTNFQTVQSPPKKFSNGLTTKNTNDASATQTIAHGLGLAPRKVRLTAIADLGAAISRSEGVFDESGQNCLVTYSTSTANSNTIAIWLLPSSSGDDQLGTVSVDATNISISWTKRGAPGSVTYDILWEASN